MISAVTLVLGGLGAASASAATPKVNASGTANCTLSNGKAKIHPALMNGGTATSVAFKFKASLSCSGSSGVTSGKIKATGTATSNDCAALANNGLPQTTSTVKWKGVGKYNPSTIVASNGNAEVGAAITIHVPSTGSNPPPGTTTITGSFAGEHAISTLVTDQTTVAFADACGSKKGLKGFTFNGVNGPSTLKIS
ncbi:MAG: hypothetical protein ACXVKA_05595 [Acidimicrobiia bacterium]